MKKSGLMFILFGFLIVHSTMAQACVNDSDDMLPGDVVSNHSSELWFKSLLNSLAKSPEQLYMERYKGIGSAEGKTLAVDELILKQREALKELLTGNVDKAIDLFLKIEKEHPGHYSTASNLGTAYELSGNNIEAIEWIKEGINRNEESHHGSEWLHVLIIRAKIEIENDPDYLTNNRIIKLPNNFSRERDWFWVHERYGDITARGYHINNVELALAYQLKERLVFVKPTDPVVADLLYTYALLTEDAGDLGIAISLLKLSSEYGFKDEELLDRTLTRYNNKMLFQHLSAIFYTIFLFIMLYLVTLFFRLDRNKKKLAA